MIINGLQQLGLYILNFFINALPNIDSGLVAGIVNGTTGFINTFKYINWFLPMEDLVAVLVLIFLIEKTYFGYWIFKTIIRNLTLGIVTLP